MREQTNEWVAKIDQEEDVAWKPIFASEKKWGSDSCLAPHKLPSAGLSSQELEASMQRETTCQAFPKRLCLACEIEVAVLWAQPHH